MGTVPQETVPPETADPTEPHPEVAVRLQAGVESHSVVALVQESIRLQGSHSNSTSHHPCGSISPWYRK